MSPLKKERLGLVFSVGNLLTLIWIVFRGDQLLEGNFVYFDYVITFCGVVSAGPLFFWMFYSFLSSQRVLKKKPLWLVLFFLLVQFGAVLYYFFVYRRLIRNSSS